MRMKSEFRRVGCVAFVYLLAFASGPSIARSATGDGLADRTPASQFALPTEPLLEIGSTGAVFAQTPTSQAESEFETSEKRKKQSALQAVGLSLLLPGAGQLYAQRNGQARLFFGVEAGIWLSYVGFSVYADWRKDDYIHFAQTHAGIDPTAKGDDFYSNISIFRDREQYVTLGRALDPSEPFYPDTPEWQWSWDSDASRDNFRDLFNDERSANRNAEFMFVAAGVNRLVSAVMAWRAVQKNNSRASDELSSDLEFSKQSADSDPRNSFRLVPLGPRQGSSEGLLLQFSHTF